MAPPFVAGAEPKTPGRSRFRVAFGTLVLLFAAAVVVFLLIAELTRGQWMLAGSAVVVLAFLLWLGNRLVHVAANQNKNPLG